MSQERRRRVRVGLPAEVRYRQAFRSSAPPRLASAADLSESGIGLAPGELLPPGTLLDLEIPLLGGGPLKLRGKVVWSGRQEGSLTGGHQAGVRLFKVDKAARKRLRAWVTEGIECRRKTSGKRSRGRVS